MGWARVATALGGLVAVIAACTGSDPALATGPEADGGGPSSPDGSSGSEPDGGGGDTGVDADLPPKAEGKFRWASAYSTANNTAAVAAAGEEVVFATAFSGTTSFDGTTLDANAGGTLPFDFIVAKVDGATGKASRMPPRWLRHFSGGGFDGPVSVVVDDAGDVIVAGQSSSDDLSIDDALPFLARPSGTAAFAFVVKLSGATGDQLWARTFSSTGDTGCEAAVAGSNVALACSYFGQSLSYVSTTNASASIDGLSADRNAVFLLLDLADGKAKWANAIGNANGNAASGVAVTAAGDVFAAGGFTGAPLEDSTGSSSKPAAKGSYYSAFVTRLAAADGKMTWVSIYGDVADGTGYVQINDLAFREGHGLVLGGIYTEAVTFGGATPPAVAETDAEGGNGFVLAVDPANGATRWQKAFGGPVQEEVRGVAVDRWGFVAATATYRSANVALDGVTFPDPAGKGNAVVLKWSPDGAQLLWNRVLAPTGSAAGGNPFVNIRGIVPHPSGDLTLCGGFEGTLDLGGGNAFTTARLNTFATRVGP
jgi:hypothetical protein